LSKTAKTTKNETVRKMQMRKYFFFFVLLSIIEGSFSFCFSQRVGINATGSLPNPSAGLDVDFTTMGMLMPRMTAVQRLAIPNPANGLLVFDTDSSCFFFYKTLVSHWISLCSMIAAQGPPGPTGPPSSSDGFRVSVTSFTNTGVDIIFDYYEFNDGGNYNMATGRYTCPTKGIYSFCGWIFSNIGGEVGIFINGILEEDASYSSIGPYGDHYAIILKLNAGDHVSLRILSGGTIYNSSFSGYKVY